MRNIDHLDSLRTEKEHRAYQKFIEQRRFADPEAAARKLIEIANSVEPVQGGRIHMELINWPFLQEHRGSPADFSSEYSPARCIS